MMDIQTEYRLSRKLYLTAKLLQLVYQIVYMCYLFRNSNIDTRWFEFISSGILLSILAANFHLYRASEDIFAENGNYVDVSLIAYDLTACAIAVITYPMAINAVELKHTNETELFAHDGEDSLGLKVNISNTSYLLNETNEQIYLSISENSSNITDTLNEYNGTKIPTTLHLTSDPMFDVFDYVYENFGLITPAIISLANQVIVALSLGWVEFVKYRIRAPTTQQSPIEMVEINNEESNH
ncbi:hypothetical protein Avbf_14078 [Armadillidium vulgare]|nr:hypothetical protein Avbf_14078 [Armadillidium vulgare]